MQRSLKPTAIGLEDPHVLKANVRRGYARMIITLVHLENRDRQPGLRIKDDHRILGLVAWTGLGTSDRDPTGHGVVSIAASNARSAHRANDGFIAPEPVIRTKSESREPSTESDPALPSRCCSPHMPEDLRVAQRIFEPILQASTHWADAPATEAQRPSERPGTPSPSRADPTSSPGPHHPDARSSAGAR